MMAQTSTGLPMEPHVLGNYLRALVNQFFKILPMWESGEKTVGTYIRSLQCELLGCRELVLAIHEDPLFLSLISILQYMADTPDCRVETVKREVFRAISICNKLKAKYAVFEDGR